MNIKKITKLTLIIIGIVGLWTIKRYYEQHRPDIQKNIAQIVATQPNQSTIIVGTNAEYPPFTFIEDNQIVGFDIDLINEIAQRIGKKVELQDMSFDALIPQLQLGRVQVVAAGLSSTPERAKQLFFTKPYLVGQQIIISPATAPIHTIEELIGKDAIVNEGFTSDLYLSKIPRINIIRLRTITDAFTALKVGRADAFVTADQSAQPFLAQQSSAEFFVAPLEDTQENTALAISKHYPELYQAIESALDDMREDGSLEFLLKKWKIS